MLFLEIVAHFLHVVSSPLLFSAIILLNFTNMSRNTIRGASGAVGALLALMAVESIAPSWTNGVLVVLGVAAGMLAAEFWISVVLPMFHGLRGFLFGIFARKPPD